MVMRNVKFLFVAVFVFLQVCSFASESGVLSFRAQRSIEDGKFAKGYSQLERALLATRKESDLLSEARVLIAMAQIRTMSLDLNMADSLLFIVQENVLDATTHVQFYKTKISILNERKKFSEAAKICKSTKDNLLKEADDNAQAAYYGECAIAYAGINDSESSKEMLKMAGKRSTKKGGFYAFIEARIADISKSNDADPLYKIAEKKSIQANKSYITATILYYRANLNSTQKKDAENLKLRCKNAFELMGLPNNAKQCAK